MALENGWDEELVGGQKVMGLLCGIRTVTVSLWPVSLLCVPSVIHLLNGLLLLHASLIHLQVLQSDVLLLEFFFLNEPFPLQSGQNQNISMYLELQLVCNLLLVEFFFKSIHLHCC